MDPIRVCEVVRTVAAPPIFVKCGGVVLRVVVCGVVLVVCCVVLFLLCVCVCDLFLFTLHPTANPLFTPPSLHLLVVPCVVMFLLCVCVCDLFVFTTDPTANPLFISPSSHDPYKPSIYTALSTRPLQTLYSHRSLHRQFIYKRDTSTRTGS